MVELSNVCRANSNFVADSIFSGNHIKRQLPSLKISRIQNIITMPKNCPDL